MVNKTLSGGNEMSLSLCHMLTIEYPVIQAGMAGGATTVDLVASVSRKQGH